MAKSVNWGTIAIAKLVKENSKELLIDMHPEYFDGHLKPVFKLIQKGFSDNQKIPTMEALGASVASKAPRDQLPIINGLLMAISNTNVTHTSNSEIVKGLKDKKLLTTMDAQIHTLTQAAMSKDIDSVRGVLNGIVEDINISRVKPASFAEAMEAEDVSKIVTCGIEGLDNYLMGMAGLTIVSGSSGSGKSCFMLSAAIGQYLEGHNILFISLELSAQVLGKRLKAALTGIPFGKIISDDLTASERKLIAKAMKDFFSRDNVFRIVTAPLDTDELLNLIQVEKSLYDVGVVYIDYLNLVGSPKGSVGGWQALSDTAKSLHKMSMELGVVSISAAQADLEKKPTGGSYPQIRTRGSAELLFSATLLIYLYKPEGDDESASGDSIILFVLKNRNAAPCQLLMSADFSLMKFEFIDEL